MTEHRVWLPFPPSVNNLFSQGIVKGKVRRFPSKGYKAWRYEAVIRIKQAKLPRFERTVVVKLELTPKDCRARDADNYAKPVLDALVEARVLPDDNNRFVRAVIPYWQNPSPKHGVVVMIREALAERPQLSAKEWQLLACIRSEPVFTVGANHNPSEALQSLLAKGYVMPVPGLLDGTPQGYRIVEGVAP
jgi:Holliday junction resolvase RusA-like endonuclease